jgi:23S rRNA C2498 (ribose-2'-O)-methylase RlmM
MKGAADRNALHQLFGHSPQEFPRRLDERMWVVDVGAALSGLVVALVKDPDEENWKPVVTGVGR